MKIATRNINGIRAIAEKWLSDRIYSRELDVVCLQETKAFESQIPSNLSGLFQDYNYVWHAGTKPWYAGTAILYKRKTFESQAVSQRLEFPWYEQLHEDGRTTEITIGNIKIINCYFPNGGDRADGREMLTYKLKFYETISAYIQSCQNDGFEVILLGDYNICHKEIDIARPKENANSIGFLPIEREKVSRLLETCKLTDAYRYFYPDKADVYTRRSYRAGARPRNVWRRIDYISVSPWLIDKLLSCEQLDQVMGSDHCPVVLEIK